MTNMTNTKLADVCAAFEAVEVDGVQLRFSGEPDLMPPSQATVCGVSYYSFFLMLSLETADASGRLAAIDMMSNRLVHSFELPGDKYVRAGGTQVIGDYLLLPAETRSGDETRVQAFGLGRMTAWDGPVTLPMLYEAAHGCKALGVTNFALSGVEHYLLALYDRGEVRFLLSNGFALSDPDCVFSLLFQAKLRHAGYSQIALLTQEDDKVFLVGFRARRSLGPMADCVDLYEVELHRLTVRRVSSRTMRVHHGNGAIHGTEGSHFSWGGAVQIRPGSQLGFVAPQSRFDLHGYYVNEFGPRAVSS